MTTERHGEPLDDAQCADCGSRDVVETVTDQGPRVPSSHRATCDDCGHRGPIREFRAERESADRTPEDRAALAEHVAESRDRQADAEVDR